MEQQLAKKPIVDLKSKQKVLQDEINDLNRKKYRALPADSLKRLEFEVLRGKNSARDKNFTPTKPKTVSEEIKSIKQMHKNQNSRINIVCLPKLPFGSHNSYNKEDQFRQTHFCETSSMTPKQEKELSDMLRRIKKVRMKFKIRGSTVSPESKLNKSNYYVFDTKAGQLFCAKNRIIEAYDTGILGINKYELTKTLNRLESPEMKKRLNRNRKTRLSQEIEQITDRLNVKVDRLTQTEFSKTLTTKYSNLLSPEPRSPTLLPNIKPFITSIQESYEKPEKPKKFRNKTPYKVGNNNVKLS